MHGFGKYEWPDRRGYTGQYVEDQKDGFGIFTWPDGRRYEGYWREGRQHGLGRLFHESGGMRLAQWDQGDRVMWCDNAGDQDNPSLASTSRKEKESASGEEKTSVS